MEITDLSWNENLSKRFNNPLLPRSIRGVNCWKIWVWENNPIIKPFIKTRLVGL